MTVSNRQIAEGILRAKALIDTPDKWVIGSFGVDSTGGGLARGEATNRVKMCLTSALDVASNGDQELWLGMAKAILEDDSLSERDYSFASAVCGLNNGSTHEGLMAKMDKAAESLKAPA